MYLFYDLLLLVLVDVFSVSVFLYLSFYLLLAFIKFFLTADVLSLDWVKRTVAVLWYRTCKEGLLVCCLVSLCITVPSVVSARLCLFFSARGCKSVLRHSTSPFRPLC